MSSGDYPYFNLHTPLPQSQFKQEKFGYVEIDAGGATALSLYGNVHLDGDSCLQGDGTIEEGNKYIPTISFNGSNVNVSATKTLLNGAVNLLNISQSAINSVNYYDTAPTVSSSLYTAGGLYLSTVVNAQGHTVTALCVMHSS